MTPITMPFEKYRVQYRLSALFLATAMFAVTVDFVRSEIIGRLQTEADDTDVIFRSGPGPMLCFACATHDDAHDILQNFDEIQFTAAVTEQTRAAFPNTADVLRDALVTTSVHNNVFFVKYDFSRWVRYRMDLPRLRYVRDSSDPIAESRNTAIEQSFVAAGRSMALENPSIQNYEHLP